MRKISTLEFLIAACLMVVPATGNASVDSNYVIRKPLVMRMGDKLLIDSSDVSRLAPVKTHGESKARQSLLLNCEKIDQAQRGLFDAERSGAQFTPLAPDPGLKLIRPGVPPSVDARYHINRNQERFSALAQRFQCKTR